MKYTVTVLLVLETKQSVPYSEFAIRQAVAVALRGVTSTLSLPAGVHCVAADVVQADIGE